MTQRTEIPRSDGQGAQARSREIQLFEPPSGALYTIEATSRIIDLPRRTILVYCKYHLLSAATNKPVTAITFIVMPFAPSAESRRFGLFAATISQESGSSSI
jgi:hypothetical protein